MVDNKVITMKQVYTFVLLSVKIYFVFVIRPAVGKNKPCTTVGTRSVVAVCLLNAVDKLTESLFFFFSMSCISHAFISLLTSLRARATPTGGLVISGNKTDNYYARSLSAVL